LPNPASGRFVRCIVAVQVVQEVKFEIDLNTMGMSAVSPQRASKLFAAGLGGVGDNNQCDHDRRDQ
jgi:hypothetical protein